MKKRWTLYSLILLVAILLVIGIIKGISVFAASRGAQSSSFTTGGQTSQGNFSHSGALPAGIKASILLPAYWGNAQDNWDALISNHPAGTIAIANYNAGPPPTYDASFEATVERARAAGIRIIGYVPTGSHNVAQIHAMIDQWYRYKMDGIFLDEATSITQGTADLGFYQGLYNYIKSKKGPDVINTIDVLNAGWIPASADYLKTADIIMIIESRTDHFAQWQQQMPDWIKTAPSYHFCATLEAVDPAQVNYWVQTLVGDNFGYIFLTETVQDYGDLPAIYNSEVSALDALPRS